MVPLIMLALSMAQKKQQQNAAEQQQLAQNLGAHSQEPQANVNLQSSFGNNAGSLLNPQQLVQTEEQKRRNPFGF